MSLPAVSQREIRQSFRIKPNTTELQVSETMNNRFHQLDSLRGIAAFTVMLSHLFLVYPIVWNTPGPTSSGIGLNIVMFSPLRAVWAGHEAVIFFFILSGLVLSLVFFESQQKPSIATYLIKRIVRIYPPYIAASLIAIAAREAFFNGPVPHVSEWFNQSWQTPASYHIIMDHVLMVFPFKNNDFNPVLWSLVHEMRISLIFPLVIIALTKLGKLSLVLPIILTLVYCLSINLRYHGFVNFEHDYFATLHYLGFFIIGAYLGKFNKKIITLAQNLSTRTRWIMFISAILLYTNPFWLPAYIGAQIRVLRWITSKIWLQEWVTAGGVIIFITLAISSRKATTILSNRYLLFMGSISYSLYLFHAVILKVVVTRLAPSVSLPFILLLTILLSLITATIAWHLLEKPTIGLGRTISGKFSKTRTKPIELT
jgi:peptidoglycan/LPS O-acetylase OafA/YrhL